MHAKSPLVWPIFFSSAGQHSTPTQRHGLGDWVAIQSSSEKCSEEGFSEHFSGGSGALIQSTSENPSQKPFKSLPKFKYSTAQKAIDAGNILI